MKSREAAVFERASVKKLDGMARDTRTLIDRFGGCLGRQSPVAARRDACWGRVLI